jgi:drug/metabolite transporter (DMT)-like permease
MEALAGGAAALLSAAIWGYSSTLITRPSQIWGGQATNLFKSVVAAVLFLFAIIVVLGPSALNVPPAALWQFAVSGVLGLAIADTGYLSALKHIGPTLTAIVYETSGIFTCILGVALLDERLTAGEIGAVALVIGGVLLAVLDEPPAHVAREHLLRGVLYGLFAAAFHACGLIVNKTAFDSLAAADGTIGFRAAMIAGFTRMTAAAIGLLVLGVMTGSLARQTRPLREAAGWRASFLAAVLGSFVAMITMQLSLTLLKTGIASVLLSMTPIFTIPIAWKMLNHRPTWRAVAGAVIALAGASLLSLGSPF